ncbi:MAG: molybdopterin molybdotransferase MoeA [Candidatus Thioglobus sp.]|nr:MAG: molybdopterin molybdotransferase MoeA [Candidatus Thioglobus sp.]
MSNQQENSLLTQPLLAVDDALALLENAAKITSNTQLLALDDVLGMVLAVDVYANIAVPGFDNSAMDGYAIHLQAEQVDKTGGFAFAITDRITAGSIGKTLAPNCAARIFTGAPVPKGANTVVMQEQCELIENGSKIEVYQPIALGQNIRPLGNDIEFGELILTKCKQLLPQDIALAASVGIDKLEVFAPIKVGVFFSGDELVSPKTGALQAGQIFNSNRYSLVAMLNKLGCEVLNIGNVKDTFADSLEALKTLQSSCDLIITTGGVSVGEEDHIKPAVQKLGKLDMWRINIKPGKPLAFGNVGQSSFIGLPGNPVSAMVTFFLFAQPFIRKMQGIKNYQNQALKVCCDFDWQRENSRREYLRVRINHENLPVTVELYPKQGSDVLSSMVWADGLLEVPENTTFTQGQLLDYYSLT